MAENRPRKRANTERTVQTVERAAKAYFERCAGEIATDAEGKVLLNWGSPVRLSGAVPTVSGLAEALGFSAREELLSFRGGNPAVQRAIKRALLRIEDFLEGRLMEKDAREGALLTLKMQFGWEEERPVLPAAEALPRIEIAVEGAENEPEGERKDG